MTDGIKRRMALFDQYDPLTYRFVCAVSGVDPGVEEQIDARRLDIDLSEHDARVAAAGHSSSYEEYAARCAVSGVESSSRTGYAIERKVWEMYGNDVRTS